MKKKPPSLQDWSDLYKAAIEFKTLECWIWMWSANMFGVQNPVTDEIGYCHVLGYLGDAFGLVVYQGTEGLEGFSKLQSVETPPDSVETLSYMTTLMASFTDRRAVKKPDLQIIKKLGLKFRGRNEWPLFRNYRPGYYPWYLTKEEAQYLTLALQQTIDVALRVQEDPDLTTPPNVDLYFVRVPRKKGQSLKWRDEWLKPTPLEPSEVVVEPVDEIRLKKIRKRASRREGIWEIDYFYSSAGIREKGERPYFPYLFLWVHSPSTLILTTHLVTPPKPMAEYMAEFSEKFVKLLEDLQYLPKEVRVQNEDLFKVVEPITSQLGIKLRLAHKLPALAATRARMEAFPL